MWPYFPQKKSLRIRTYQQVTLLKYVSSPGHIRFRLSRRYLTGALFSDGRQFRLWHENGVYIALPSVAMFARATQLLLLQSVRDPRTLSLRFFVEVWKNNNFQSRSGSSINVRGLCAIIYESKRLTFVISCALCNLHVRSTVGCVNCFTFYR